MSDLDDKLLEILRAHFRDVVDKAVEQHGETVVEFAERSKLSREEALAQIHHAFRDSGYRFVPKQEDIQHLIDDGTFSPLETGQEWFNRFMKEIQITSDIKRRAGADHKVYTDEAIEAAKRAAGIEGGASLSTD